MKTASRERQPATLRGLLRVRRVSWRLVGGLCGSDRTMATRKRRRRQRPNLVLMALAHRVLAAAMGGVRPERGVRRVVRETGRKFGQ